ncbi:fungal-specific transcription factor domain-containing protein [Mycena crocata]|nr:fungal-specific transcription factor domain-containing protein [Mycena crocata]
MLSKCLCQNPGGAEGHLQFRPEEMDEDGEEDDMSDTGIAQELCVPTENLKLEERDLLLHGITAPFRFGTTLPDGPSRFPEIIENPSDSYVLMVEGVDEAHYNPDFNWSRYLPSQVPLDRREHDRVLDLCFKFFTSWCMRIVPALFLRDMYRHLGVPRAHTPPKTPHYSPMLHNALIALATAFSDDPRIRDLKSRQYFAAAAKNYIEEECQRPNISVVHALSILGSFHSSQGDQMLGYMYFGMSARISQALGLSIDSSSWVRAGLITHDNMLDRNWAYWTTFTQDVCWSIYVGREASLPSPSKQVLPVPFIDADFDQIPWHFPKANIAPQPNFLSRTFAASCDLLAIARRIITVVNSLGRSAARNEVNDQLITDIDVQLNGWKSRLTPEVNITPANRDTSTPHRLMLHCTYWFAFILLHRPFFHRKARPTHGSDREVDHVKLCKRAAENIMELLHTWRSLYSLRYAPVTLVQVIFSGGTIFLLLASQATAGTRIAQEALKSALMQAELCIQYLLEIGKSWQCATNIGGILRNLLQEQLKPVLDSRTAAAAVDSAPRKSARTRARTRGPVSPAASLESQKSEAWHSPPSGSQDAAQRDIILSTDPHLEGNYNPNLFAEAELSGFLAMLGGETLPEAPFIAPFSMMDESMSSLDTENQYTPGFPDGLALQDVRAQSGAELADLEAFWQDYLR